MRIFNHASSRPNGRGWSYAWLAPLMLACSGCTDQRGSTGTGPPTVTTETGVKLQELGVHVVEEDGAVIHLDFYSSAKPKEGLLLAGDLNQLKRLLMSGARIDDDDLKHLEGLQQLDTLVLNNTPITDEGLVHLRPLSNLRELNLNETRISDRGLEHLTHLPRLRRLNLHSTETTDAGLVTLSQLTELEGLNLHGTSVTDAGLEELQGLTSIQWLWLTGTQVTEAGVTDLKKALPSAEIIH